MVIQKEMKMEKSKSGRKIEGENWSFHLERKYL